MNTRQPKNPTPTIPRASGCAAPAGKTGNQGDLSERARVACFSASLFSRKEKNHSLGSAAEKEQHPTRRAERASPFPTTSGTFVHSPNQSHASGAGGACPAPTGSAWLLCRVEACLDRTFRQQVAASPACGTGKPVPYNASQVRAFSKQVGMAAL